MWLLYPRRNRNRHRDLRSPRNMAPGWRRNKRGLRGFDPPRASDLSAQKEDTRSLSMVQESH